MGWVLIVALQVNVGCGGRRAVPAGDLDKLVGSERSIVISLRSTEVVRGTLVSWNADNGDTVLLVRRGGEAGELRPIHWSSIKSITEQNSGVKTGPLIVVGLVVIWMVYMVTGHGHQLIPVR